MSEEVQAVRSGGSKRVGASRARKSIQPSEGRGSEESDHRTISRAVRRLRTNVGGREAGQRGPRGGSRDPSTMADKRKAMEEEAEAIAAPIVAGATSTFWRTGSNGRVASQVVRRASGDLLSDEYGR